MVELYAGHGSLATELRSRGWRVTTVECASKHQPTIKADVVAWVRYRPRGYIKAHGVPDAVVAGPPCCTRSTEARGRHREVGTGTGKLASLDILNLCYIYIMRM